jgi:thiol:disulfide interchange protein
MKRFFLLLLCLLLPLGGAQAASQIRAQHYDARLVAKSATIAPGEPLTIALAIIPDKGWHIYWSNPGETGYPPALTWKLPNGAKAGELQHPLPMLLVLGGFASNVHEGETILLQDLKFPPPTAAGKPVHLSVDVDLLVCSEASCVPDPVTLDLDLTVGDGTPDAAHLTLFKRATRALPARASGQAEITTDKGQAQIFLPGIVLPAGAKAHIFGGVVQALTDGDAQSFKASNGGLLATLKTGDEPVTKNLPLVLRIDKADGTAKGYSFNAKPVSQLSDDTRSGTLSTFLLALGGALLGGLILNLMPCVFPILSLKAMALAKAGGDDKEVKSEAIGYSIGATATILALGALLLLLRSGGHAMGWAFQLQDTRVVALLLLLVTAIAVNMSGLFELPSLSINGNAKSGFVSSIGTGALAAFIATPCTGPFMAGALGAALLLPVPAAMAIFFGLGLGLSLPFLLLGFWKPSRKWLPKPGLWMVKLRQILSLPMFATAVGLAWIIGRQGGADAMAIALAAAIMLGVALWWYGLRQMSGKRLLPVAIPMAAAISLAVFPAATSHSGKVSAASVEAGIIPYSADKLDALRTEKKPVFVYMTADWCLSCKVNEATSLSSTEVTTAWKKAGVTVMRGDWTNGDPAITAFLKANGSAGVPIYIWYPAQGKPKEMPQVLTPSMLTRLITDAG